VHVALPILMVARRGGWHLAAISDSAPPAIATSTRPDAMASLASAMATADDAQATE